MLYVCTGSLSMFTKGKTYIWSVTAAGHSDFITRDDHGCAHYGDTDWVNRNFKPVNTNPLYLDARRLP